LYQSWTVFWFRPFGTKLSKGVTTLSSTRRNNLLSYLLKIQHFQKDQPLPRSIVKITKPVFKKVNAQYFLCKTPITTSTYKNEAFGRKWMKKAKFWKMSMLQLRKVVSNWSWNVVIYQEKKKGWKYVISAEQFSVIYTCVYIYNSEVMGDDHIDDNNGCAPEMICGVNDRDYLASVSASEITFEI